MKFGIRDLRKGACRKFDYSTFPDLVGYFYPFFGPEGEGKKSRERREQVAKSICSSCDVVDKCLTYALELETSSRVDGVYGGKTEDERKEILRERRKQEVA